MASRVDVVLATLPGQMDDIRARYERDLAVHKLSDHLLHDIARYVEDCQRVLDWTATDIDRAHGKGRDRSPYFPLHTDSTKFAKAMRSHFPAVPSAVVDAFERHQPGQPGKTELGYLHQLARVNKHQDFTPQKRIETRRVEARSSGGGSVSWDPGAVTFGSGVSINGVPVDPRTQRPVSSPTQVVTETIYVGWKFTDPPVPVLPTLEALGRLVHDAVTEIRQAAGL